MGTDKNLNRKPFFLLISFRVRWLKRYSYEEIWLTKKCLCYVKVLLFLIRIYKTNVFFDTEQPHNETAYLSNFKKGFTRPASKRRNKMMIIFVNRATQLKWCKIIKHPYVRVNLHSYSYQNTPTRLMAQVF